ncbi:MAG: MalM family protein [Pseudomonadota bacterium]|nr:MalM family protein [Pseudomonadota bacterium]
MTTRARMTSSAWLLVTTVLAGCQVGGSTVSDREGYFTWVDEQGRVRHSPIAESEQKRASEPEPPVAESARARSPDTARTPSRTGPEGDADASEYTLENYPDAGQLAKDGYIRPGQRQPYFTWRDSEGNLRVSYFQPDTRSDADKGRAPAPVELTPASVYHAEAGRAPVRTAPEAEPDAFAVLGIDSGGDFLERFSATCCTALDTDDHEDWHEASEFGIDLDEASPWHGFLSGRSPYHAIALSGLADRPDFVLRLRSYADDGVFVASLVFLDRNLKPVRLVTDLVSPFTPETWSRRGFLEAWVPVLPGQGERWLVIFTRDEDLAGQTVLETRRGPKAIPHVTRGELGLRMAGSD